MKNNTLMISTLIGTLLLPITSNADEPLELELASLRESALNSHQAMRILESLTTEIGPRMAGSKQDALAVAWAKEKFKSLGFDKVWTEPVNFKTWIRGKELAEVVTPYRQTLAITALGSSIATPESGIQAQIIHFPTIEDLIASKENSAAGKIVFISRKMERFRNGQGYRPVVKARSNGAAEAAKKGAVAIVIRSVGTDSHRLPHTGMMRYQTGIKKIPAAALSNPDADLLLKLLAYDEPVALKLLISSHEGGNFTSHNVMGEITGSSNSQHILIGGHLDSWDLGTGAVDDGAGVAITMAAAALIGNLETRPKKTIRVALWANEEQGLYGGKAYAKKRQNTWQEAILGAESDFGAGKIYAFSANLSDENTDLIKQMKRGLAPLGITQDSGKASPGPDLIAMHQLGMPVFNLRQDGTNYFDLHHTADDTLDKIDPDDLAQNVAAYAVFLHLAANYDKEIRAVEDSNP